MPNTKLTLTVADYARLWPLMAGDITPEGIDLALIHGTGGSWPERAEMLRRALADPEVAGGEASMAAQLRRLDKDDRRYVGLPVFPLRNFTARDLYVRKDGPIRRAADLVGKRVGMYDWVASGSIWYRHFLHFIGVAPDRLEWWIGDIEGGWRVRNDPDLPEGVHAVPAGQSLSDMLIAGEIDAMYSPPRPSRYDPEAGPIVRLFRDFRGIEADYYRRTQCFPPQHLVVLKREVWERDKTVARRLNDAFIRAGNLFAQSVRGFPYVSPWFECELEETASVIAGDPYADGFAANREMIATFCRQAHDARLTERLVTPEDYFAEFLAS